MMHQSRLDRDNQSITPMRKAQEYVYWQDGEMYLGYLKEYPDHWTQGETIGELEDNLLDIYDTLKNGAISDVQG